MPGTGLGQAEKGIAAVAPEIAACAGADLRRVTWQRMSFSEPLVCNGTAGRIQHPLGLGEGPG